MTYETKVTKLTRSKVTVVALVWSLLIVMLIITLSLSIGILGYRPASTHGSSMEPALHDGDAILLKHVEASDVKVGDIVALYQPNKGPIAHRVVKIDPLSHGDFSLQTKGDANQFSESWHLEADQKIGIAILHIRFAGNLLEFIQTMPGLVLLICCGIALLFILTVIIKGYTTTSNS